MTFEERCQEAATLFEQGNNAAAVAIFEELAADESVDRFGRAMMCLNIATVEAKGGSRLRVMKAYERAAGLGLHGYLVIQLHRLAWMRENGQAAEGIKVVTRLLDQPDLLPEDRAQLEQNLRALKAALG